MKKIDEQPDRPSFWPERVSSASFSKSALLPISSETTPPPELDMRSDEDSSVEMAPSRMASRRAWLRRGVAVASPVVVTLVSGPVYAADGCILPSGFISPDTFASRHPGGVVCTTMSMSFLANNVSTWQPKSLQTAPFSTIFGGTPEIGVVPGKTTLLEVLKKGSDLARYSISAYLNALMPTGSGFPLKPNDAIAIYKSYRGGGFSPLLVRGWSEGQTVRWLQMLIKP